MPDLDAQDTCRPAPPPLRPAPRPPNAAHGSGPAAPPDRRRRGRCRGHGAPRFSFFDRRRASRSPSLRKPLRQIVAPGNELGWLEPVELVDSATWAPDQPRVCETSRQPFWQRRAKGLARAAQAGADRSCLRQCCYRPGTGARGRWCYLMVPQATGSSASRGTSAPTGPESEDLPGPKSYSPLSFRSSPWTTMWSSPRASANSDGMVNSRL